MIFHGAGLLCPSIFYLFPPAVTGLVAYIMVQAVNKPGFHHERQ